MKIIAKYYIYLLFCIFFFLIFDDAAIAKNVKNSAVVFMYHKFDVPKYPSTNIKLEQLEAHLSEFSKKKYNIASLEYIVDAIINDSNLPENTIGFSVDDADISFLPTAFIVPRSSFKPTFQINLTTFFK